MNFRAPVTQDRAVKLFLAAMCLSPGCVRGRCYATVDCPAPKVCDLKGACVLQHQDASTTIDATTAHDVNASEAPWSLTDADLDTIPGCPAGMAAVADFCIDLYEASRGDATVTSAGSDGSRATSVAGVLPWQVGSNAEAALACAAAGKRLCSPAEWQMACEGPDETAYAYGDSYDAKTCNGIDSFGGITFHLAPTGSFPGCTDTWGVFDMNGNLWEHVAGGTDMTVRGGAYNCSDSVTYHRCDYIPTNWTPSARGFRCCADREPP